MAVSSNYKSGTRQARVLTEETAFSGGMMWTGNNIDETHLKTIINFNYDDTTGFLKTRDPLIVNDTFKDTVSGDTTISGLYDKTLIGAYNICASDASYNDSLSKAGWLYLFGDIAITDNIYYCPENSLVWVYRDTGGAWHKVEFNSTTGHNLIGTTGIKPILYDNVLYCTNDTNTQAFYAYKLFVKDGEYYKEFTADGSTTTFTLTNKPKALLDVLISDEPTTGYTYSATTGVVTLSSAPANEAVVTVVFADPFQTYTVSRQSFGADDSTSLFTNDAKSIIDSVTLLEATVTGFNAMRGTDMFTYASTLGTGTKSISGCYLKDSAGNICVTPRLGQEITIFPILNNVHSTDAPENETVKLLKLKTGSTASEDNSNWTEVASTYVLVNSAINTQLNFKQVFTDESVTYQLQWYTGTVLNDSLIVTYTSSKLNTQLKLKTYAVPSAKGSCLWNGHLVLWDIEGASNSLFISEVDNFYYMPTPNNVALFETDIISCIPYMGALLIFTADRVYRLSESNDGGFVQEVVQNNMPLARADAAYLRAIKNMIFFKSGNYYYMVVPKAQSLTGELTVAPIYKNLAGWFDNTNKATETILAQLYPDRLFLPEKTTVSNPTDIYVEQDTVSILYDVSTVYNTKSTDGTLTQNVDGKFVLFVNYNTNLRSWTMYIEDTTDSKLFPANLTAARLMSFVRVARNGAVHIANMQNSDSTKYGVRCMLDTGYRTLSNALHKRFREVQLKLYSVTENITNFGSAFYIDGCVRKSYTRLEEALLPNNANVVSLVPVYDPNTLLIESSNPINTFGVPSVTVDNTGSDSMELSDWDLDFSHFKRGAPATIRIPVSGKGTSPRFVFMSPKCINISVNEINWVYRVMYGR